MEIVAHHLDIGENFLKRQPVQSLVPPLSHLITSLNKEDTQMNAWIVSPLVWGIEGIHRTNGEPVNGETVSPVFHQ